MKRHVTLSIDPLLFEVAKIWLKQHNYRDFAHYIDELLKEDMSLPRAGEDEDLRLAMMAIFNGAATAEDSKPAASKRSKNTNRS